MMQRKQSSIFTMVSTCKYRNVEFFEIYVLHVFHININNGVIIFLHVDLLTYAASSPYFQTMVDVIVETSAEFKVPTSRYIYNKG